MSKIGSVKGICELMQQKSRPHLGLCELTDICVNGSRSVLSKVKGLSVTVRDYVSAFLL